MDREEFRAKQEEINRLVDQKKYKEAMAVVDTIEWKKVRNARTLSVVGEIYAANKRYEDSIEIFLMAYNRAGLGKNILCRLVEISLKIDRFEEAEEFLEEFEEIAPNDNTRYILRYKILKARKEPLEEQIAVLEEYRDKEFTEKWAYELARLYYRAGESDKCIDLCDTMLLWFSDGPYVKKALELKRRLSGTLNETEVESIREEEESDSSEEKEDEEAMLEEQNSSEEAAASETVNKNIQPTKKEKNSLTFQQRVKNGLKDLFGRKKQTTAKGDLFADDISDGEDFPEPLNIKHSFEEEEQEAPKLEPEGRSSESNAVLEEVPVPEERENPEEAVSEEKESLEAVSNEMEKASKPEEFVFVQPKENTEQMRYSEKPATLLDPDLIREIMEEKKKSQEETDVQDGEGSRAKDGEPAFNLEDAILAAAFAQGIDLGEVTEKKENIEEILPLEEEAELEKMQSGIKEVPELVEEEKKSKSNPIERLLKSAEKQLLIQLEGEETVVEEPEAVLEEVTEEPEAVPEEVTEEPEAVPEEVTEEEPKAEPEEAAEEPEAVLEEVTEEEPKAVPEEVTEEEPKAEPEEAAEEPEEVLEEATEEEPEAVPEEVTEEPEAVLEEVTEEEPEAVPEEVTEEPEEVLEEAAEEPEEVLEEATEEPKEDQLLSQQTMEFQRKPIPEIKLEKFLEEMEPIQKPVDEKEAARIVSRKRELSEEDEILFGYFIKVPGIREQILDMLSDIQDASQDKTSNTGNIVVMGGLETGKTQLISRMIPAICKVLYMEAAKVAYIYADQLKGKDMARIVSKMAGGFLVIENISLMDADTVQRLNKAMEFRTDGLIVILEEEKNGMREFLEKYPEFAKKFTSRINIPVFTNDELVNFAHTYVQENGFFMEPMGITALYEWIGKNQNADAPMTIGMVKEKLDAVIRRARGGAGFKILMKKRAEKEGLLALGEKDFK